MVVGGASTIHANEKPVYAETGDTVATFYSNDVVNYRFTEYDNDYWRVSWGGNYKCGFNYNEWKTFEEQGYAKYVNGVLSANRYGWVVATVNPLSFVGSFDFVTSSKNPGTHLYLTSSTDGENYSPVVVSGAEQGCTVNVNTTYTFDFDSTRKTYYAIIVASEYEVAPSSTSFQFDNVICHFYEKIDPNAERVTISGSNTVYVGYEDIVLTATAYNANPTEFTWTNSDDSVATVTSNGNTLTVHALSRGTTNIVVSFMGSNNELIYTDPFTVTVKKFEVTLSQEKIAITPNSYSDNPIRIITTDANGTIVVEAVPLDDGVVDLIVTSTDICFYAIGDNGSSTIVTITVKDNNGADGCHIVTKTIPVYISSYSLGKRITAAPAQGATKVFLANESKTAFVHVDIFMSIEIVDNINDASWFYFSNQATLELDYLSSGKYISGAYDNYASIEYNNVSWGYGLNNSQYPGLLENEFGCYLSVIVDWGAVFVSSMEYLEDSEYEPLFAYPVVEPGPRVSTSDFETTYEVEVNGSTDISIDAPFISSLEYEVLSGDEYIDSVSLSNVNESHNATLTVNATGVRGTSVIRIRDVNNPTLYYYDITVNVVRVDMSSVVNALDTQTQLSYRYSKNEDEFTYTDISMRFGGRISKDTWDMVDTNYHDIEGFGVMITAYDPHLRKPYRIKDHYEEVILSTNSPDIDTQIVNYYMPKEDMAVPPEEGDDYVWNLFFSVDYADIDKDYKAVAYIKVDGDYYFMNQVEYSVTFLAWDYLNNRGYEDDVADGSLKALAESSQLS